MPSPRLRAKARSDEPFSLVQTYMFRSSSQEKAYWEEHREAWIAAHKSRREGRGMPDVYWRYDAGVLLADDPAEPIVWRDWFTDLDGRSTSEETMEHLARCRRLGQRREQWLQEHGE